MTVLWNTTFAIALTALGSMPSVAQWNGETGTGKNLTPLMIAASKDDVSRVRELLAHGAKVNERTATGETALYEAIERRDLKKDNLPVVKILLAAGADANQPAIFNASPLDLSLTRDYGNPKVTLLLINSGAKVSAVCVDMDSEVSLAAQDGLADVVSALIQAGALVNCQYRGMTALHWASLNGFTNTVSVLLDGGANPSLPNGEGKTALDIAVTTNAEKQVQQQFAHTRDILKAAINKKSTASS